MLSKKYYLVGEREVNARVPYRASEFKIMDFDEVELKETALIFDLRPKKYFLAIEVEDTVKAPKLSAERENFYFRPADGGPVLYYRDRRIGKFKSGDAYEQYKLRGVFNFQGNLYIAIQEEGMGTSSHIVLYKYLNDKILRVENSLQFYWAGGGC